MNKFVIIRGNSCSRKNHYYGTLMICEIRDINYIIHEKFVIIRGNSCSRKIIITGHSCSSPHLRISHQKHLFSDPHLRITHQSFMESHPKVQITFPKTR